MDDKYTIGCNTMRLEQFDRTDNAVSALKNNFNFDLDVTKLNKIQTRKMLVQFMNVIEESKKKASYDSHNNASYLKALMIAEALTQHYKTFTNSSIIVENQAVEQATVTLAAQELVDKVQKMVEQCNDMLVKELPALVDSMQSEVGVNEANTYNQAASSALTQLNQSLSQTRSALNEALNALTGQGADGEFSPSAGSGEEMAVTDVGATQEPVAPAAAPEAPLEEPVEEPGGAVGRAKR